MLINGFGSIEERRCDWVLYSRSEVDEKLQYVLEYYGMQSYSHGDSGYISRPYFEILFHCKHLSDAHRTFNESKSSVRMTVEWMFNELKLYWSTLDYNRKLRISESPVAAVCLSAMLLSNIRNTMYASPIAQYFECESPKLDEYLSTVWRRDPARSSGTNKKESL